MASPKTRAAVHPTRQPRSVATQERILAATESLLAEGDPELLTMEQIAERAHVSVGAIYKRFQGKASLLPLVLERVHAQQLAKLHDFLGQPRWREAGLGERVQALLQVFADEIRHPNPPLALSLGLFTTLQTIQTAVMLGRVPPALGLERFVAEQARMFRAYLGLDSAA